MAHEQLTQEQQLKIKELHKQGIPTAALSERFGISKSRIRDIVSGRKEIRKR